MKHFKHEYTMATQLSVNPLNLLEECMACDERRIEIIQKRSLKKNHEAF